MNPRLKLYCITLLELQIKLQMKTYSSTAKSTLKFIRSFFFWQIIKSCLYTVKQDIYINLKIKFLELILTSESTKTSDLYVNKA